MDMGLAMDFGEEEEGAGPSTSGPPLSKRADQLDKWTASTAEEAGKLARRRKLEEPSGSASAGGRQQTSA